MLLLGLPVIVLAGCLTPPRDLPETVSTAPAPPEEPAVPPSRDPPESPERSGPPDLSLDEWMNEIETALSREYTVLRSHGRPSITRSPQGGVFGIVATEHTILLVGASRPTAGEKIVHYQEKIGEGCTVETFQPFLPHRENASPEAVTHTGFESLLVCGNRESSLYVLVREGGEPFDFLVRREPLSSVSRTVLRDLTGDGMPELLRYSRVFESGGRRELFLEAFHWNGQHFVLLAGTSLLRRIDQQLDMLERRFARVPTARFRNEVDRALFPLDDAPPASTLLPTEHFLLPRLTDIPLQLGATRWSIDHEIALEGHVYRIRLLLEANPLVDPIVQIQGFEN